MLQLCVLENHFKSLAGSYIFCTSFLLINQSQIDVGKGVQNDEFNCPLAAVATATPHISLSVVTKRATSNECINNFKSISIRKC